jgi:hypothetical protein
MELEKGNHWLTIPFCQQGRLHAVIVIAEPGAVGSVVNVGPWLIGACFAESAIQKNVPVERDNRT